MTMENVEHIIIEHLKHLRGQLDNLTQDVQDLKVRTTSIEEGQAGINRRLDRLDERVHRIEKRLELTDA